MWIWLILSILLVIACIIFGIHSFLSSRSLQRSISSQSTYKKNTPRTYLDHDFPTLQQHDFSNLKIKLKAIEGNTIQYSHQLKELQKRIEALEDERSPKKQNEKSKWDEDEEDWEKLYYETLKEKETLEEELSLSNETLQATKTKLEEIEKQEAELIEIKSDIEDKSNQLHSLQNVIDELQRKLAGANEREAELEKQLTYEKFIRVEYDLLQKENNQLRSEAEELKTRLEEINAQNIIMDQKLNQLTELESSLEISEYEKMEIKKSVEQIIAENMALSEKLQDLQSKLTEEKKYS